MIWMSRRCIEGLENSTTRKVIDMRLYVLWVSIAVSCLVNPTLRAEAPVFDAIDYALPEKYLVVAESLGNRDAILKQATSLKGPNDKATLTNILRWINTDLKYDGERAYEWRNFDTVFSQKCYGGCADQAIVCGVLLQSAGIPTVWVKTMDVDWIWDFKKERRFTSWSGHVFLEIYMEGQWVLLDPGASRVYTNYSTGSRILPGNRFAYHKGSDPKQMVMSLQWEEWKQQTSSYFKTMDESLLPVDPKSAMDLRMRCFVIANSPFWQLFSELVTKTGAKLGSSFNVEYDKHLPLTKWQMILIETHDGVPIVDVAILQRHFPSLPAGKQSGKVVVDGTTLIFVDVASIVEQVDPATVE